MLYKYNTFFLWKVCNMFIMNKLFSKNEWELELL